VTTVLHEDDELTVKMRGFDPAIQEPVKWVMNAGPPGVEPARFR